MSTIETKIWIPAKWDEEKKCWIPLPEEARKIIPSIDDERVRKWVDEYTVELAVQEVRILARVPIFVGRKETILPPARKLDSEVLVEHVLKVDDNEVYRFYLPRRLADEYSVAELVMTLRNIVREVLCSLYDPYTVGRVEFSGIVDFFTKGVLAFPVTIRGELHRVAIRQTGYVTRGWWLEPGHVYQLVCEWVRVPNDMIVKDVKLRSSYRRGGWDGHPSNIEPGFEGHIIYTIHAPKTAPPLVIEEGARALTMRLYKLEKPAGGYRGQFQGV